MEDLESLLVKVSRRVRRKLTEEQHQEATKTKTQLWNDDSLTRLQIIDIATQLLLEAGDE